MDRYSLITQKFLNDPGEKTNSNCGEVICVCEPLNRPSIALTTIALAAFLLAFLFFINRNNLFLSNVVEKRNGTIACARFDYSFEKTTTARKRANDKDGATCPHQFGASCIFCFNEPKKKRNYTS